MPLIKGSVGQTVSENGKFIASFATYYPVGRAKRI